MTPHLLATALLAIAPAHDATGTFRVRPDLAIVQVSRHATLQATSVASTFKRKEDAEALARLASADPSVRTRAACDLRKLGSDAAPAMTQLTAMLEDASPVDSAVCGERTWRGDEAGETTSPGEQAASALVAIGSPAYSPLAGALKGTAWVARKNAAWALGALGHHTAVPLLTGTLRDTEPAVRRRSAWALGALDGSEAVPALIETLNDTDAKVREQVAWALGTIGDPRAVEPLIKALSDAVAAVRERSAWALGTIGDNRAVPALTRALKDTDAGVRRRAAWALGTIGG